MDSDFRIILEAIVDDSSLTKAQKKIAKEKIKVGLDIDVLNSINTTKKSFENLIDEIQRVSKVNLEIDLDDSEAKKWANDYIKLQKKAQSEQEKLNKLQKQNDLKTQKSYYDRILDTEKKMLQLRGKLNNAGEKEKSIIKDELERLRKLDGYYNRQLKKKDLINNKTQQTIEASKKELELQNKIKDAKSKDSNYDKANKFTKDQTAILEKSIKTNNLGDASDAKSLISELSMVFGAFKTDSTGAFVNLDDQIKNFKIRIDEVNNKLKETHKLNNEIQSKANKIDSKIANGDFRADIAKSSMNIDKLYGGIVPDSLKSDLSKLKTLSNELNLSLSNENKIKKYEEYDATLKKVTNQIKVLSTSENMLVNMEDRNKLAEKIQIWSKNNTKVKEATKQNNEYVDSLRDVNKEMSRSQFEEISNGFSDIKNDVRNKGKLGLGMLDSIKQSVKIFGSWLSITQAIMSAVNAVKQMRENVYEVDTAMTNLKKVTDETDQTYAKFLDNAGKRAENLGRSMSGYITQVSEWSKLGYSMKDSQTLAEKSSIYANVGELSDEDAVSYMVSTMKAFEVEAGDVETIIDEYNELGNKFSTDSASLGEGMTKMASALSLAGNSMEQSLAMLTGTTEITQNANESANALKVLSMRIRGMKGKLEELGEESEGIESISKIQTQIMNLSKGSVNIFDEKGNFKSTYEIMKQISKVWNDMSQVDQSQLLEILAGKQRGNQVAALIKSFQSGQVEKAYVTAMNSDGSAQKEQDKWKQSLEAKQAQREASFQNLSTTVLDSDLLKDVVDSEIEILDFLNSIINKIGLLPPLLMTLSGIMSFKNFGIFQTVKDEITGANSSLAIFGYTLDGIKAKVAGKDKANAIIDTVNNSDIDEKTLSGINKKSRMMISQEDLDYIEAYNEAILHMNNGIDDSGRTFEKTMSNASQATQQYVKSFEGATVSTANLQVAQQKLSLSARVTSAGLKALSIAGNVFAGLAIGFVTDKLVSGISNAYNANEKLMDSASELGNNLSEQKNAISDYKQQIDSLYKTINSNSSSLDEVKQARQNLMKIQDELIEKFGDEKTAINSITEAIDGQSSALDNLSNKTYLNNKTKLNNSKSLNEKFADFFVSKLMLNKNENSQIEPNIDVKTTVDKIEKEYSDAIKNVKISGDNSFDDMISNMFNVDIVDNNFKLVGSIDEIYDKLSLIQDISSKFELSPEFEESFSKVYTDVKNTKDKYNEFYDQYILYDKILNTEKPNIYDDLYKQIITSKKSYDKAVADGDDKVIRKQSEMLIGNINDSINLANSSGDKDVANYFKNMYPELKEEIGKWNFEFDLNPNSGKIESSLRSIIKRMNGEEVSTLDFVGLFKQSDSPLTDYDIENFDISGATDKQLEAYAEFENFRQKYGLSQDKFIEMLKEKGIIIGQEVKDTYGKIGANVNDSESAIDKLNEKFNKETKSKIESELKNKQIGGEVNLLLRPKIDTSELKKKGWNNTGDGTATIFSSTFSNENGTESINFTPIIADPKTGKYIGVLSQEELQNYAESVINGTRKDDLNLQIGTKFTGKDSIDEAVKEAEELHKLQEEYYLGDNYDINDFFNNYSIDTEDEKNKFFEIAVSCDTATEAEKKYLEYLQEINSTKVSVDLSQILSTGDMSNIREQLFQLSRSGKLDEDVLSSNEEYANILKRVGIEAKDAVDAIKKLADESDEFSGGSTFESGMDTLFQAYQKQFDKDKTTVIDSSTMENLQSVFGANTDAFNTFKNAIINGKGSIQQAFNGLANSYLDSTGALDSLTEKNKDYYISELKSKGIVNAKAVVENRLANIQKYRSAVAVGLANCNKHLDSTQANLVITTKSLENATWQEISALIQESGQVGVTSQALALYALKKAMANASQIHEETSIKQISLLADIAGIATGVVVDYINAKNGNIKDSSVANNMINKYNKEYDKAIAKFNKPIVTPKVNMNLGTNYKPDTSGGTGSRNQKEKKQTSDFKDKIDWNIQSINVLQRKFDNLNEKLSNTKGWNNQVSAINKVIEAQKNLSNGYSKQAKSYESKYNSSLSKISKSLRNKVKSEIESGKTFKIEDFIAKNVESGKTSSKEKLFNNINEAIDWYNKSTDAKKNKIKIEYDIDENKTKKYETLLDKWNQKYSNSTVLKDQISATNKIYTYEAKLLRIQKENTKSKEDQLIIEKQIALLKSKYAKQKFDDTSDKYSEKIDLNSNKASAIEKEIDIAEEKGYIATSKYYNKLLELNSSKRTTLQNEKSDLLAKIKTGSLVGSDLVDAKKKIYEIDDAIKDCDLNTVKWNNSIKDIANQKFEKTLELIEKISDESDFYIDMYSNEDMFDDKGNITDNGKVTKGLHAQNYDTYLYEAQKYKKKVEELNSAIQNGDISEDTLKQRDEYKKLQNESIKNAEDERQAIINLVKDGYEAKKNAMKDAIDKEKELMEEEKKRNDYEKEINEKTKNINVLQKQIDELSLSTDRSDIAQRLKLEKELKDAKEDLDDKIKDTDYEERENALDKSYEDYEKEVDNLMKDTNYLFKQSLSETNRDSELVFRNIKDMASKMGTTLTEEFTKVWSAIDPVTYFENGFINNSASAVSVARSMASKVSELFDSYSDYANVDVTNESKNYSNYGSTATSKIGTSNVNASTSSQLASIRNILNSATGNSSKPSNLNKYVRTLGYKDLSQEQMIQLANLLGIKGLTISNIKENTDGRQKVIDALKKIGTSKLKKSSFSTGGQLIKKTGEDGLFLGKNKEWVITESTTRNIVDAMNLADKIISQPISRFDANAERNNTANNITFESPLMVVEHADNTTIKDMEKMLDKKVPDIVGNFITKNKR